MLSSTAGANPSTNFAAPYGGVDGFVAKFDQDGNFLWAFKLGGNNDDNISSIALDPSGNIYIAGTFGKDNNYFSGTSPLTPASTLFNADKEDFFIAKYNPDGAFQWIKRSETDADDMAGLSVYANATAVYATGTYKSNCAFGSLSISRTFGAEDMFLIKYNSDGDEQWLINGGSDKSDYAYGVTADESNVYVTGNFLGNQMEFQSTTETNVATSINSNDGKEDGFLISYDENGTFNWTTQIKSNEEVECFAITMDSDSLYITGGLEGPAGFQLYTGNPVITSANQDIFFSSHSKVNGNTGWVHAIACRDGGAEYGRSITLNSYGDLIVAGYFKNDLFFPEAVTLTSAGAEDVFVCSYSNAGVFKWALNPGSNGADFGYGVSAGSDGSLYLGGSYDKQMFFGAFDIPEDGGENSFLAKLQVPCEDAVGGTAAATETEICVGQTTTLSLKAQYGQIIWQSSPAGMDIWSDLPGETFNTVTVSPIIDTDYRAYLSSINCNPDSSNILSVQVFVVPLANAGSGGNECDLDFQLQATPSVGTGTWTWTTGTGTASFVPNANDPNASQLLSAEYRGQRVFLERDKWHLCRFCSHNCELL